MAIGALEIATVARSQDYTAIKHNDDTKPFVQQTALGQQLQKDVEQKTRQVRESDNSDWQNKKFDAKEKGQNEYAGDGGAKKEKEKSRERVVLKGHQGFDMKI